MGPVDVAEAYEKTIRRFPQGVFARKIVNLGVREGKALDVACGPGHLLVALSKAAPRLELHGVDISAAMLEIAGKNLDRAGLREKATLHSGSAYELPFDDAFFDLVTCTNALHGMERPERFFSELARVMRSGGLGYVLAYRRDVAGWMRWLGGMHSRVLAWRHVPLDGMRAVLDASYSPAEVRRFLERSLGDGAAGEVRPGRMLITIILRK